MYILAGATPTKAVPGHCTKKAVHTCSARDTHTYSPERPTPTKAVPDEVVPGGPTAVFDRQTPPAKASGHASDSSAFVRSYATSRLAVTSTARDVLASAPR